jgi:two-component system nitrate/nitrite response regulator NarL
LEKDRVSIIEDEPILRNALVSVINQSRDFIVAGEYATAKPAISRIAEFPSVIILMDVHLEEGSTVDHINSIKRQNPYSKVLMLTSDASSATILDCFRRGADGYLLKEDVMMTIGTYLENARKYEYVVSPGISNTLIRFINQLDIKNVSPNREQTKRLQQLTRAQRAVYRELLTGKNYREIAKIIGISKNTVGQHIQRIYKTFGVNSTTELLVGSQDY